MDNNLNWDSPKKAKKGAWQPANSLKKWNPLNKSQSPPSKWHHMTWSDSMTAKSDLKMTSYNMKQFHDCKVWPPIEYKPGDLVLLEATNIKTEQPSKKLNNKQYGPFKVIKKEELTSYCIKLDKLWHQIHPIFHKCLLYPYHQGDFPSQKQALLSPPEIIFGVKEAEVEYIIDSKCIGNTIHYLIHCKGFPHKENEWIPIKELTNVQMAIKDFHHSNSDTPRLTIKIQKMSTEDAPCLCSICLRIPLSSPSPLFSSPECKELQKQYNKYDSSYFKFPLIV